MFIPTYTIAKIRQSELLNMAAQRTIPQSEIYRPLPLPITERLLLDLGNLLIASGERLKGAVESAGYPPMQVARK